ncbi:MAG: SIR2 family protein [Methylotetracoccus sp.]
MSAAEALCPHGDILESIVGGLYAGDIVPYLGPAVLDGVCDLDNGQPIPASGESLILALNDGRPMAPKLMYEFPRAAMNVELKRGRKAVEAFLTRTYGERRWSRAPLHDWLATWKPGYVIDINRDGQLQDSYVDVPHLLVRGVARIAGTDYRYMMHRWDGSAYQQIRQEEADTSLPVLFKPMGSARPTPQYIASDADYVDYITELMGGFAVPSFLKEARKGKRYVLVGVPLGRDTERMVLTDLIYGAAEPKGWLLDKDPSDKTRRFCARNGLEVVTASVSDLLAAATRVVGP